MVSQGNNDNVPKFNDPFTQNPPFEEKALVDQPNLSPCAQSFFNNPYNKHMMDKFINMMPIGLWLNLLPKGPVYPLILIDLFLTNLR